MFRKIFEVIIAENVKNFDENYKPTDPRNA